MAGPAIVPRNVHFEFDDSLPVWWHSNNPAITSYFDALSFTFPEGERFFIDSVKYYANRITDPKLKEEVAAFTAQEAVHSREHVVYNRHMGKSGVHVKMLENHVKWFVTQLRKLPPRAQLAITCALEHFTALFAEATLGSLHPFENAHPFYRDLWHWHAMEEEEHKSVAFDVFRTVTPGIRFYFYRCIAMAIMTFDFTLMSTVLPMVLLAQRGELFNLRAWAGSFWFHWIAPGVWPRTLWGVAKYFVPGFHPSKRKVAPEVLKWRQFYRESVKRAPGMPGSLFEGVPGAA